MPATHSKKRKGGTDSEEVCEKKEKHPGGPLKRTGQQADEWEAYIGPSLDQLSPHRLPTKREVLQRYRALRVQLPNAPKRQLAAAIADEIVSIWANAHVPSKDAKVCTSFVCELLDMWTNSHRKGARASPDFQQRLDTLLNVAPCVVGIRHDSSAHEAAQLKHVWTVMRASKNPMWERDYNFFVEQLKVSDSVVHIIFDYHTKQLCNDICLYLMEIR